MKVALSGARISQERLASRVRLLFDHGDTSTLEIIFGARSLDDALGELDSLEHVTSINNEVLTQLAGGEVAHRPHVARAHVARGQARGRDARAGGDDARARRSAGGADRVRRQPPAASAS